jgi:histidinol-phosphate aminotransferase
MILSPTDWIRPEIQQLLTHQVPEPGAAIKLDAMENPYQWDDELKEKWLKVLHSAALNRYPDPQALKQQLRTVMQIPEPMEIILGNGSDELIQMLVLTLNGQERVLLAPEPSFVRYRSLAQIVGMQYVGISLEPQQFELDIFFMLEAVDTHQPALVFLAYPNNPTGNAFAIDDIEAIVENCSGLVVIDEAYAPFADQTLISYLERYPNLLVMRTVSHLGLAGLRLGFLVGSPQWLEQIDKTRLPHNINILTQLSATFALENYSILEKQTERIKQARTLLFKQLNQITGVDVWSSQANFILFRVTNAATVFEKLKQQGILIKCLHGNHPLLDNCLSVTVGTQEENQAFLQALASIA